MTKDEDLSPEKIEEIAKSFETFLAKRRSYRRVTINHDNNPDRLEALKWFMSYDDVERGQLIRIAYEMWQEQQQVVLQQVSGEA